MESGFVKMYDKSKNYGFIVMDDGEEFFFHTGDISNIGNAPLREGDRVKFDIKDDFKGSKAVNIKRG